jgi:hypothetical protein
MGLLAPFVCLWFFFFLHESEYLTDNYSQPASQPAITGHTYNNLHRLDTPASSSVEAHRISNRLMPPLW